MGGRAVIDGLSDDLLIMIFMELSRLRRSRPLTRWFTPEPHAHAYAHVCRRWRSVALQRPLLWDHVELGNNDEFMHTLVLRSQNVPLTIRTDSRMSPTCVPLTFDLAHDTRHRLHCLELCVTSTNLPEIFNRFQSTFPVLRHLLLQFTQPSISTPDSEPPTFMLSALAASTPNLISLSLHSCNLITRDGDEMTASLVSLTQLRVSGEARSNIWPAVSLEVLACLPQLKSLQLHHALLDTEMDAGLPVPVALPHLAELTLFHSHYYTMTTLQSLRVPNDCHIGITATALHDPLLAMTLNPIIPVARYIAPTIIDTSGARPRSLLRFEVGFRQMHGFSLSNSGIQFRGWFTDELPLVNTSEHTMLNESEAPHMSVYFQSELRFFMPSPPLVTQYGHVMSTFCSSLSLVNVQTLVVSLGRFQADESDEDISPLAKDFDQWCPRVRVLAVRFMTMKHVCDLLAMTDETSLLFPVLQHLILLRLRSIPRQLDRLLETLEKRRAHRSQLESIQFVECDPIPESTLDRFRGIAITTWR